MYFIFRMVWNYETLYHHCFSTLFRISHQEGPGKSERIGIEWNTVPDILIHWVKNINTMNKNGEAVLEASKEVGLEVNTEK
jgi:hypothetical protein